MSEPRTAAYIAQIRRAACDARAFVAGLDKDDFLADLRTQQAVMMNLMIIGETAARLIDRHPDFVLRNASIPWTAMRGLRNRIAHGYFEVDMDIVLATVQSALPDLLEKLEQLH